MTKFHSSPSLVDGLANIPSTYILQNISAIEKDLVRLLQCEIAPDRTFFVEEISPEPNLISGDASIHHAMALVKVLQVVSQQLFRIDNNILKDFYLLKAYCEKFVNECAGTMTTFQVSMTEEKNPNAPTFLTFVPEDTSLINKRLVFTLTESPKEKIQSQRIFMNKEEFEVISTSLRLLQPSFNQFYYMLTMFAHFIESSKETPPSSVKHMMLRQNHYKIIKDLFDSVLIPLGKEVYIFSETLETLVDAMYQETLQNP